MIKLKSRGIFEVLVMSIKRLSVVVFVLLVGCQQATVNGDKPVETSGPAVSATEPDRQLQINKNALLEGSTEQIQLDAATILLQSDDGKARKVLLEVLRQSENTAARTVVCKALSQARSNREPIRNKGDFLQPLLEMLTAEDSTQSKLAAEAMLIFDYEQVGKPLQTIADDGTAQAKSRLNAIYALRLQPDMRAIITLIELLDDPDKQVSSEAEKTIRSLGIPVGKNLQDRRQIIGELRRKGRDVFLRDWLLRQEEQVRRLESEAQLWQKLYLDSLDEIYEGLENDDAKAKFLAEKLNDPKVSVKLWAMEKVSQWRVGTRAKLPSDEIGALLVNLVSNENRDVRLKTARLLSLMGEIDSASKLLAQIKVEQDDEVKTELFVALGGACYYAFLPNSGIKIAPEIRKQTLEIAAQYLASDDDKKAQKGAEVIKKLLEQDGLALNEVENYLGLLAQKYEQQKNNDSGVLRGELLSYMASLCAQSVYKAEAARRFEALFEQALKDDAGLVREAAMDGLIYTDKTKALELLRTDFVNDDSAAVRKKLTDLAAEVGGPDDLQWLVGKIGAKADGEQTWQTMLKIFKRSDWPVLNNWMAKFTTADPPSQLTDERKISFFEFVDRKATTENKTDVLKNVRSQLATSYSKTGDYKRAAECLGFLIQEAKTPEAKNAAMARLMDVYLRWPNVKAAKGLVNNCLLEKDFEPNSVMILAIDNFLNTSKADPDPNVISQLAKIQTHAPRPVWENQLKIWSAKFPQPKQPKEVNSPDSKTN
jgi:HEAT repeat protein